MATLTILLITIGFIWTARIWDSVGQLLSACAIALVIWTLLKKEKPTTLLEFSVKSLIISYATTSITWFVTFGTVSPYYYTYIGLWGLVYTLTYIILLRSLLPVAVSIVIFGTFRTKLKPWEILLSSWYVSIFAVFAAYSLWWTLFVQPTLHDFYSSGAGALARDMLLALLAFFFAASFTAIYLILKGSNEELSP